MNSGTNVIVETFNLGLLSFGVDIIPNVDARFEGIKKAFTTNATADIIGFTEVFERNHRDGLIEALLATHPFSVHFDNSTFFKKNNGLLLVSRFPLIDAGYTPFAHTAMDETLFCERGVLYATAQLEGGKALRVLLTHVVAGGLFGHPESPKMDRIRAEQLNVVLATAAAGISENVIIGDLNCGPGVSDGNYRQMLDAGYDDAFVASGADMIPDTIKVTWDPKNALNANGPHKMCPAQRIDHVLLSSRGHMRAISARILRSEASVATSKGQMTLSDHYALQAHIEV